MPGFSCNCSDPANVKQQIPPKPIIILDNNKDNDEQQYGLNKVLQQKENKFIKLLADINMFFEKVKSCDPDICKDFAINVPRFVVVGTQTSGKSSLINQMIGIDLLPTGTNMVTQSPIHIEIFNPEGTAVEKITLGYVKNGVKLNCFEASLLDLDTETFKQKVTEITYQLVGNHYAIVSEPIFITLTTNKLPCLYLVDIPGLIAMSRQDKGQPLSIIEDIKSLAREQLSYPNTYALVCITSKIDLETDIGLSLIKDVKQEMEINRIRYNGRDNKKYSLSTVGVMTKPDLLDQRFISEFDKLVGDSADGMVDLKLLDLGYFVVNNIDDTEQYYLRTFGKKSKIILNKKYGTDNLIAYCIKRIINKTYYYIQSIIYNLKKLLEHFKHISPSIGEELDEAREKQLFFDIHAVILKQLIGDSINAVGFKYNIGNEIKTIISNFEKETYNPDPFNETNLTNTKLIDIINSFEGYIQTSKNKELIMLNRCISEDNSKSIRDIHTQVEICIKNLKSVLMTLITNILSENKLDLYTCHANPYSFTIKDFPNLRDFLINATKNILDTYGDEILVIVKSHLDVQENSTELFHYDPSDKPLSFATVLNDKLEEDALEEVAVKQVKKKSTIGISTLGKLSIQTISEPEKEILPSCAHVRRLLKNCYQNIIHACQELTIQTITSNLLRNLINKYDIEMFIAIKEYCKNNNIDNLFYGSTEKVKQRERYSSFINDVQSLLNIIDDIAKFY